MSEDYRYVAGADSDNYRGNNDNETLTATAGNTSRSGKSKSRVRRDPALKYVFLKTEKHIHKNTYSSKQMAKI
jgi:hypothetical protein